MMRHVHSSKKLKTIYCTFHISRILTSTSLHEGGGYFVLFPDLLGLDYVLEVEDVRLPLCYPVPITIFLHNG